MYILKIALLWLLPTVLATNLADQQIVQPASFCPLEPFGAWLASGICPIAGLRRKGNGTRTDLEADWIKGTVCHEIPGGSGSEYCSFTRPSFNYGLGVSIITTLENFQKLSKMPVFREDGKGRPVKDDPSPPFKDVSIPDKGIGLVATRPIEASEVYMARTPSVMLDDTAFRLLGRSRLTALLVRAVGDLPRAHRAEYLKLTTHSEVESHADRIYQIFMKNNFRTEIQDIEVFHSAFTQG